MKRFILGLIMLLGVGCGPEPTLRASAVRNVHIEGWRDGFAWVMKFDNKCYLALHNVGITEVAIKNCDGLQ